MPDTSSAHWVAPRLIAVPPVLAPDSPETLDWRLHWSPDAVLQPGEPAPVPWSSVPLRWVPGGVPVGTSCCPNMVGAPAWQVPDGLDAREILRGQVMVGARTPSGRLVVATGVQHGFLLDNLYPAATQASLGVSFADGVPRLRVWAPTAQLVRTLIWTNGDPDASPKAVPMTREDDGCWTVVGEPSWLGARYQYEVTVYAPEFRRIVTNRVTDPYSVALTVNSTRSVILDLDDPRWAPPNPAPSPPLKHRVDQVCYELHVRDFSAHAADVAPEKRGTYLAFADENQGTRHLRRLAEAGLTTVQLLPIYDFSSVEERASWRADVDQAWLRALPSDASEQQAAVKAAVPRAYNWGYDPWHVMAPEGSYATIPDGGERVRQARTAISALHGLGLRVVVDVVFNHTSAHGQAAKSVLDRIVPGYYHRLGPTGDVYDSTCCSNVATERRMAEKLMVDACVLWARHYRVDGFRFDLMGHHSRANLLAVRAALDALTLERDGIDGRQITIHGEGWDFGEVAGNSLFVQAKQGELDGTGIATFNDRLRDAVRGGSAFEADPRSQGWGTGLWSAPNDVDRRVDGARLAELLRATDLIQLSLAGNVRDFEMRSAASGDVVRGGDVPYGYGAAGYAAEPDEVLNYVDAHDNETLFDACIWKLPSATRMEQRVQVNTLCLALATWGQAPVLWHAGTDFLRSKSLDRNSYDSGDWFNVLDFSPADNGFGRGLPPAPDNERVWPLARALLRRADLRPSAGHMRDAHAAALDVLRVRASSRLFRLGSAEAIGRCVSFPVSGTPEQLPGVIVMMLDDRIGLGEPWQRIAVIFNGRPSPVAQIVPGYDGTWRLHPVQEGGAATSRPGGVAVWQAGTVFEAPGRTAAVFVQEVHKQHT